MINQFAEITCIRSSKDGLMQVKHGSKYRKTAYIFLKLNVVAFKGFILFFSSIIHSRIIESYI